MGFTKYMLSVDFILNYFYLQLILFSLLGYEENIWEYNLQYMQLEFLLVIDVET